MPVLDISLSRGSEHLQPNVDRSRLPGGRLSPAFFYMGLSSPHGCHAFPQSKSPSAYDADLGLCLLGTAVGSVIAVPVTGWLVTRFGSKRVTTWSTAGFCIALIAPSLAVRYQHALRRLDDYGAMAGANDVSINSQAVAVETALGKPTMSRFHAMFSIGGMVGASLGGLVAANGIAPQASSRHRVRGLSMVSLLTASHLLDAHDHASNREGRVSLKNPWRAHHPYNHRFLYVSVGGRDGGLDCGLFETSSVRGRRIAAAGYAVFSAGMAIVSSAWAIPSRSASAPCSRSGRVL